MEVKDDGGRDDVVVVEPFQKQQKIEREEYETP